MPPRVPGTLSNGVLSLKFMQRGLAADQKPVEAEKAQVIDDSHWEIAHSQETKALLNPDRQKGFEVTYEASYMPFLYATESNESGEAPGPSLPTRNTVAFSGRRVFRSGQEVITQEAPAAKAKNDPEREQEGELRYSSPSLQEDNNAIPPTPSEARDARVQTDSKPTISPMLPIGAVAEGSLAAQSNSGKPQFLRPADVDVAAARTTNGNPSAKRMKISQRDKLAAMVASAKASTPSPESMAHNPEQNNGSGARRKATVEEEGTRPRKRPRKTRGNSP